MCVNGLCRPKSSLQVKFQKRIVQCRKDVIIGSFHLNVKVAAAVCFCSCTFNMMNAQDLAGERPYKEDQHRKAQSCKVLQTACPSMQKWSRQPGTEIKLKSTEIRQILFSSIVIVNQSYFPKARAVYVNLYHLSEM